MPRLDVYLHEQGFAASRSLAAKLIRGGWVLVNGSAETKPGAPVQEGDGIVLRESPLTRYVSRGGLKLEAALEEWNVSPAGLVCADVGASTGGFTDCLLQHGAKKVFAVDSGTDQLHPALRENENVVVMENVNARFLTEEDLGKVDLVVMDVSFISQTLLFPAIARILRPGGTLISLIKPQFEAGREALSSGGIVRSEKAREACVEAVREKAAETGFYMLNVMPSPITGGDGNIEYLALFSFRENA